MRRSITNAAMAAAFVSLVAFAVQEADARSSRSGGGGGGGARSSGASSMSRGGGGGSSGFSRSGSYSKPSGGTSASQRPSGSGNRPSTGNAQRPSQQPSGGNRNNINTGGNTNVSGGNRNNINTGNINTGDVNINRDVNIDVDGGYHGGYYGGWRDYPIAAGVAIGTVAVMTAAAIGSAYYTLPPACNPYVWQTYTYYTCGSVYYRPQYQGDTIVYVVVDKPK